MISYFIRHYKETYYYAFANFLDRASYYGIRSLLVIYLMSDAFAFTEARAAHLLEVIFGALIVSKVVGACLGDLLLGNKKTLILGGLLQAIGMFTLCISNLNSIYFSIALIVIGGGMFSPNITSLFGKLYSQKSKLMDAGFTIFYTSIILGAFIGGVMLTSANLTNIKYGFILSGLMMLVSTFMCALTNNVEVDQEITAKEKKININVRITQVVIAFILVGIFWFVYEFTSFNVADLQDKISGEFWLDEEGTNWLATLKLVITLLVAITASIFWTNKYIHQYKKMTFGFILAGLSLALLLLLKSDISSSSNFALLVTIVMMSIGEIFIAPLLYSVLTKYGNPKYLAILISLSFIPSSFLMIKTPAIVNRLFENSIIHFGLASFIFFSFAFISFILFKLYRKY
ncbi:MAG: MFS transporter [Chitinophagaceae bacterium]|nr:MFS transporter [Chitinophagaceae bacterium]